MVRSQLVVVVVVKAVRPVVVVEGWKMVWVTPVVLVANVLTLYVNGTGIVLVLCDWVTVVCMTLVTKLLTVSVTPLVVSVCS